MGFFLLTVTMAYSSMKPCFEPAKRHRKVRMRAAALSTAGISAEKRIGCLFQYLGIEI
jgi:hypothetical protein